MVELRSAQQQQQPKGSGGGIAGAAVRVLVEPVARWRDVPLSGGASASDDAAQTSQFKGVIRRAGQWYAEWRADGRTQRVRARSELHAKRIYDAAERARAAEQNRVAVVNHPRKGSKEQKACRGDRWNKTQPVTIEKDSHGFVEPEEGKEKRAKLVGVYWKVGVGLWSAEIGDGDRQRFLGHFCDPVEAAKAYDAEARKLGRPVNDPCLGGTKATKRVQHPGQRTSPAPPPDTGVTYKYVYWCACAAKWHACVRVGGLILCNKYFDNQKDAALYVDSVIRGHELAEHLPLNFPKQPGEVQAVRGRVQLRQSASSKYRGVYRSARTYADSCTRWYAQISAGTKDEHLGAFKTEEAAARAYDAALRAQRRRAKVLTARLWEVNFPCWLDEVRANPESRAMACLPGRPAPPQPEFTEAKLTALVEALHRGCGKRPMSCDTRAVLLVRALRRSIVSDSVVADPALVAAAIDEARQSPRLRFLTYIADTGDVVGSLILNNGVLELRPEPTRRAPECAEVMLDAEPCEDGSALELHSCPADELAATIAEYCKRLCYHRNGVDLGCVTVARRPDGMGEPPPDHILVYVHWRDADGAPVVRFVDLQANTQKKRVCGTLDPLFAEDSSLQRGNVFWCPAALVCPAAAEAGAAAAAGGASSSGSEEGAALPRAKRRGRSSGAAPDGGAAAAEQPAKRRRGA